MSGLKSSCWRSCLTWIAVVYALCVLCSAKKKESTKSQDFVAKEMTRLRKSGVTCPLSVLSLSSLDRLRVTGEYAQAIACHLRHLDASPNDDWAWSSLASTYILQADTKANSNANTCFKIASKLGGKVSSYVRQWHFVGPFVIGKTEVDGDPIESQGGIKNAAKNRYNKGARYLSEVIQGGEVGWTVYKQARKGEPVKVAPQVNWNDLVNSLGSVGIMEWQGWILGEIAVNEDNQNIVLQCLGVQTMWINDVPLTGDVYHRGQFWFPVKLSKGIHTLYIKLRTKVRVQFLCNIDLASSVFDILKPHFLPDIYSGYLCGAYIPLPISNKHSSKWLRNIRVSIDSQSAGMPLKITHVETSKQFAIAPGHIRPITLQISSEQEKVLENCEDINIQLKIATSEGASLFPLTLRCRKSHESFLFTFMDHDGSVQHAAAIEPIEDCVEGTCPVLLTLHGTTVPPQNQADSYKHMVDGKFIFGLDKAWLLAPTRHGAHNWEGPGALTAIRALEELAALTASKGWLVKKASSTRVIYAGHSMGGHGAWQLATHLPDRALAVISLAGWIKKEEYGDSNFFFRHDVATSNVDPAIKAILEACIAENEADRLASNLHGLSVLVRIGAEDRTIHPFFNRRMYRVLRGWNINVTYTELPEKEHWWWDTRDTNDGGAVNDQQLRDFTNYYASRSVTSPAQCEAASGECGLPADQVGTKYTAAAEAGDHFTYTTMNPAFGETFHGLQVLQQTIPFRTSLIEVKMSQDTVELITTNVARFTICEPGNRPIGWWQREIRVDNQSVFRPGVWKDERLCVCRHNEAWNVCSDCHTFESSGQRGPANLGPARRVAEHPFVIITGTQGSAEATRVLRQAAVYIANLFFLTSDNDAPVITDAECTNAISETHNLIILGNPNENSLTSKYIDSVPLEYSQEPTPSSTSGVKLGSCHFRHPNTGALFLAPHQKTNLALILMGNSLEGFQDAVSLATPTIPPMTRSPFSNLIPDFVITGPKYRAQGPGGYLCAGFWGNNWDARPELASCAHCL